MMISSMLHICIQDIKKNTNGMEWHIIHHQEHLSRHPIQLKCPEALFSADLGANIYVFFF